MLYQNQAPSESNEEKIIRELVDDIYNAEAKIFEISSKHNEITYTKGMTQLEKIDNKQSELQRKLSEISNLLNDTFSNKNPQIIAKLKELADINQQITEIKKLLSEYNPVSFNCLLLSKYILLANSARTFLTNIQIEEILTSTNTNKDKFIEFKKYKRELENKQNIQSTCIKSISETNSKLIQMNELLKMLKEEKNSMKEELINIISTKESIEEIIKMNIINMTAGNANMTRNFPLNKSQKDLELFSCEMVNLDVAKATSNICEGIMEVVEMSNRRSQSEILSSEVYNDNERYETISNDIDLINNTRETLQKVVKSEIANLTKSLKIFSYETNRQNPISQFILTLSNIILNTILSSTINNSQNLSLCNFNTNITPELLSQFLIYSFKLLYYENIIKMKINFINKEYKSIKKERLKQLEQLNNTISKFNSKLEDIEMQIKELENIVNSLNEYNDNTPEKAILTIQEKTYIELSIKGNMLLERKKELENEVKKGQEEMQRVTNNIVQEKQKVQNDIYDCESTKKKLQSEIEKEKLKLNQEIILLRQVIAEKFNIIKSQLQIYKNKYGTNLPIYNNLIESINLTIKNTEYKPQYQRNITSISNDKFLVGSGSGFMNTSYSNQDRAPKFSTEKKKKQKMSAFLTQMRNDTESDEDDNMNEEPLSAKRVMRNQNLQISNMNMSIDKAYSSKRKNLLINTSYDPYFDSYHQKTKSTKSAFFPINPNDISMSNSTGINQNNSMQILNTKNTYPSLGNSDNEINNDMIFIEEKGKLERTIKNIKEKKYQKENSGNLNINMSNISALTQITFCYYRTLSTVSKKFNPLTIVNNESIINPPYNFNKGTISINKKYTAILLSPTISLVPSREIPLDVLENTVVNKVIKKIIDIQEEYENESSKNVKKVNLEQFAEREVFKQLNMTKKEIIKAVKCQSFNFSLLLSNSDRVEIVFENNIDFQKWMNGIAFIIKNKAELVGKKN